MLEGRVRFQLGDGKRVIGPEDGELIVGPGVKHGLLERQRPGGSPSGRRYPTPCGFRSSSRESAAAAQEGLFTSRPVRSAPQGCALGRGIPQAIRRRDGDALSPPQIVQRALIALLAR